jgi:hypothetical protein
MAALSPLKRGEGIAYGWKGKGCTIHLLTEANGLPLAFLVTAANVADVTVGLRQRTGWGCRDLKDVPGTSGQSGS